MRAPLPRDSIVSMRIGKSIDASRTNNEEFLQGLNPSKLCVKPHIPPSEAVMLLYT